MISRNVGWTVILIIVALGMEGVARLTEASQELWMSIPAVAARVNGSLALDAYKMAAPDHGGHWRLRPGYGATTDSVIASKQSAGKAEGAAAIAAAAVPGGRLTINHQGFKGPEIDPAHGRPRILVLGDSVTFGYPDMDYVRIFQDRLAETGVAVEAINGGVEGYWLRNHLLEMDRYLALKPETVVILAGWNDIYGLRPRGQGILGHLAVVRLWDEALRLGGHFSSDEKTRALRLLTKPKRVNFDDPMLPPLATDRPDLVGRAERLSEILAEGGARIVIATLPGLYLPGQDPSGATLAKGHLPRWTDNPLALAAATEGANAGLRRMAARHGWAVVDFDAWSREALVPRDRYFLDSVHLTAEGYRLMGNYLAASLRP